MRGASALQRAVSAYSQSDLIVIAIWEPILPTDRMRPGAAILGRLTDTKAQQYWDPDHFVAASLARSIAKNQTFPKPSCCVTGGYYWDLVAFFPKGSEWDSDLPAATFIDGPVVDVENDFAKAIKR